MDREYFKQLQKDASDHKYPPDNTKLRQAHADYARGLIDRWRDANWLDRICDRYGAVHHFYPSQQYCTPARGYRAPRQKSHVVQAVNV